MPRMRRVRAVRVNFDGLRLTHSTSPRLTTGEF